MKINGCNRAGVLPIEGLYRFVNAQNADLPSNGNNMELAEKLRAKHNAKSICNFDRVADPK